MQKSTESVATPDFGEEYREAQKALDKKIPLGVKLGIVAVLVIMLFASFALGKYPVAPDELVKNVAAQITVGVYNLFNDPNIVSTGGLYGKDQPTFENIAEQNLFYPSQSPSDENIADPVETPAVLAFTYGSLISGVDVEGTRYIQADTVLSRAMAAQVVANSCYSGLF